MNTVLSVPVNPFPGLRPFREDEQHLFFGRENQIDAMVDKLAATRFLAVVGTSGSGKSSLVNCGLRPALHGGLMARAGTSWRIAQFRPGSDPLRAMARALAGNGVLFRDYQAAGLSLEEIVDTTLRMSTLGLIDIFEQANLSDDANLLVVVDQFEELFRYRGLEGQSDAAYGVSEAAVAFTNLLLEAHAQTTHPIYVVLTMRSDFLGDCTQFPGLAEAINAGQYLVPRMSRDERREAIGRPVAVGGAEICPVLLTRLVNDVGDNPDQLSILQHALNRTWARWQHESGGQGPLELRHYEAIGTMARALDQHAEKAFADLDTPRQQHICEKIFKALTDRATDVRGVRRPTALGTLCALTEAAASDVAAVIDVFRKPSRSFLMPPAGEALEAETVIDISHESLMRVWERLKRWGDEEAQSAQTFRRLADAAARHAIGKGSLWRNPELQLALDWRDTTQPNEAWALRYGSGFEDVSRFLRESEAAQTAELAKEQERQRAEAQRAAKERELEQAQVVAEVQRQRADDLAAAKVFQDRLKWGLAAVAVLALSLAGFGWSQKQEAQQQAERAEEQAKLAEGQSRLAEEQKQLAEVQKGYAEEERLHAQRESEQAKLLQVLADDNAKRANAGAVVARSREVAAKAESQLAYDPELSLLLALESVSMASTEQGINALRRALALPAFRRLTPPLDGPIYGVAFSPNGKWIAAAGKDQTVRIWDAETGRAVKPLEGHTSTIHLLAFSPDSRLIATEAGDQTGKVWDVGTGKELFTLEGLTGDFAALAFSPDNTRIAAESGKTQASVWDVATHRVLYTLAHDKAIRMVVFSPDGKLIVTASDDSTARVWDAFSGSPIATLQHGTGVVAAAFSTPGDRVVTASVDGTARIFTTPNWDTPVVIDSKNPIHDVQMSRDRIVTANEDGTARIWDFNGRLIQQLTGHNLPVTTVRFSPDGQIVVTATGKNDERTVSSNEGRERGDEERVRGENTARVWSVLSGRQIAEFRGHKGAVIDVTFSPDGRQVVTGARDGTVRIWAANAQNSVDLGPHLTGMPAFSPDGTLVIAPGDKNSVVIRDSFTGKQVQQLPGHSKPVRRVALGPNDTALTAGEDGNVRLWEWKTGQMLAERNGARDAGLGSNAGLFVTVGGEQGRDVVRVWNRNQPRPLGEMTGDEKTLVMKAVLSPAGTLAVIVYSRGNEAILWNYATGERKPLKHDGRVYDANFNGDGSLIVTASADTTARVWDARGNPVAPLTGHADEVNRASFNPSGDTIATTSDDNTVRIWARATGKVSTWRQTLTLQGHGGPVYDAAFSFDGKFLLTASRDRTARIWDTVRGEWMETFGNIADPQLYTDTVAFSPNSTRILTTSTDNRITVYVCALCRRFDELESLARSRVTRQLTREEREEYVPASRPLADLPVDARKPQ
jgi:WD40 repeat protein